MKKIYLLLLAVLLTMPFARAQSNSTPLQLSKKIFSTDSFPDLHKHITGEYNGHPNGHDDINPLMKISFELLSQNLNTAVVAIQLSDSSGVGVDTYLHFKKDTIWKAQAFRALAMTGMIQAGYEQLKALTPAQVDSVIKTPNKSEAGTRMFKSKKEYQYLLNNAQLTLSSDKQLIAHFIKNKVQFEKLKNELVSKGIMRSTGGIKSLKNGKALREKVEALLLHDVRPDDNGDSDISNLNFTIGGILDNTVGYLYIPDVKYVPKMSPHNFIMIRKMAPCWYIYKTT